MEGNMQKMREALMQVSLSCSACPRHNCKGCTRPFASFMPAVRKALSAPARQCDVGTTEEQAQRFGKFCIRHKRELEAGEDGEIGPSACVDCKVDKLQNEQNGQFVDCGITWAQTPYESKEGGDHVAD